MLVHQRVTGKPHDLNGKITLVSGEDFPVRTNPWTGRAGEKSLCFRGQIHVFFWLKSDIYKLMIEMMDVWKIKTNFSEPRWNLILI